jgi:hypothetical protein
MVGWLLGQEWFIKNDDYFFQTTCLPGLRVEDFRWQRDLSDIVAFRVEIRYRRHLRPEDKRPAEERSVVAGNESLFAGELKTSVGA